MQVLHVVPAYPDDARGHREGQNYRQLLRRLSAAGTGCIAVAARQYRDSPLRARDGEVEVRRFAFGDHHARLGELGITPARALRYWRAGSRAVGEAAGEARPVLLHAHTPVPCGALALGAARRLRVPVVLTLHGSDLLLYPRQSAAVRWATRWVLRRATRVTAVASHLVDASAALAPGVAAQVLPIGFDDTLFRAGRPAEERERLVVSTRTLAPLYSVETLVRAARKLGEQAGIAVSIYGDGPERERLEAAARGAPVRFHGFTAAEDLAELLGRAAVYVSTATSDGTSVSLLEALACGAYPIVADIEANRRWIQDRVNGRLVPVADAAALAAAVREAMVDVPGRARAAEVNPTRVADAAWSAVIPRLQALYAEAAAGGAHPA